MASKLTEISKTQKVETDNFNYEGIDLDQDPESFEILIDQEEWTVYESEFETDCETTSEFAIEFAIKSEY